MDQTGVLVQNPGRAGTSDFRLQGVNELLALVGGVVVEVVVGLVERIPVHGVAVNIGEAEHIERDLRLLAEPHQLENLKETIFDAALHRPAEVKQEHDAVVLAVLLDDLRQEDIVMGAVLVQTVKVQHPGLLGTLPADLVRSLLALKLRDQLAHERIGLAHILPVLGQGSLKVVGVRGGERITQHIGADDRLAVVLQPGEGDDGGGVGVPVLLLATALDVGVHEDAVRRIALLLPVGITGHLHLLHSLLHLRVTVEELGDFDGFLKSLDGIHHVRDLLLLRGEVDGEEAGNAPLEVEVQAVDDPALGNVHLGEREHIPIHDLLVAQVEVAARTGVLRLHHLLNADILHHVGDPLKEHLVEALLLRSSKQLLAALVGSPQGVADLMGDQHGLHRFRHIPNGHRQVARLGIERGSLRVLIEREGQVLGGKGVGKDGERVGHGSIVPQSAWKSVIGREKLSIFCGGPVSVRGRPDYYPPS